MSDHDALDAYPSEPADSPAGQQQSESLEKRLRELEYRASLLDQIRDRIIMTNLDGRITYVNAAVCEGLGKPRTELIGQTVTSHENALFICSNQVDIFHETLKRGSWNGRIKRHDQNGAPRFLECRAWLQQDINGNACGICSISNDVTEHARAEDAARRSEERYTRISAAVMDYMFTAHVENDKVIRTVHGETCEAMTGYAAQEFENDPFLWFNMVHEDDRNRVVAHAGAILSGGDVAPIEHRIWRKDGSLRWIQNTLVPHHDECGHLISYDGLIRDITERKHAEDALHASEALFRQICELAPFPIAIIDSSDSVEYINPRFTEMTGYAIDDVPTTRSWMEKAHIGPARQREANRLWLAFLASGDDRFEPQRPFRVVCKDGSVREFLFRLGCLTDGRRLITLQDVTEYRQAMEEVRRLNQFQEIMIDNANVWVSAIDRDRRYIIWNKAAERITGYAREEVLGHSQIWELLYPDPIYRTKIEALFESVFNGESIAGTVLRIRTRLGSTKYISLYSRHLLDEYGRPAAIVNVSIDITGQQEAEDRLRESEEQYRRLVETMNEGLAVMNNDGLLTYVNDRLCAMLLQSREKLLGRTLAEILSPRDPALAFRLDSLRHEASRQSFEVAWRTEAGSEGVALLSPSPVLDDHGHVHGCYVLLADLTALKRLEERVARGEKMESLGRLAGGVAHDLNNILSGIVSYPDLLLMDLDDDSPMRQPLEIIRKAGLRAAGVVEDLLTLTRRGVQSNSVVDINRCVTDYFSSPEYARLLENHPAVETDINLTHGALLVLGSKIHLGKAVMNLVSNAMEAMPDGGLLTVRTRRVDMARPWHGMETVPPGHYVVLDVRDSGIGISPDNINKVFEPFYTRKEMGRSGTGLGLTVVWGAVHDHGGYVNVQSAPGEGAVFSIYLPLAESGAIEQETDIPIDALKGSGTILVVDDMPEQRELANRILSALGYSVETASGGEEAVDRIRAGNFDLVLLDMLMPGGMDGLDTYRRIIEIRPGQKAIIVSGYAETAKVHEAISLGAGRYIRKPYSLAQLGLALKEELS